MGFGEGLSVEDIHELLGAVGGEDSQEHNAVDTQSHQPAAVFHQTIKVEAPAYHQTIKTNPVSVTVLKKQEQVGSNNSKTSNDEINARTAATEDSRPMSQIQVSQSNLDVSDNCSEGAENDAGKAQQRSERKRSREKQRRSDVSKQFSDLTQLLQRVESEDSREYEGRASPPARMAFNPSNRVDLIARTNYYLERLLDSNKRRKTEIDSLKQDVELAKKAGEDTAARLKEALLAYPNPCSNNKVMMMVPMMLPANSMQQGATAPSMSMMNPFAAQAAAQGYSMMAPQMGPGAPTATMQQTTVPAPAPMMQMPTATQTCPVQANQLGALQQAVATNQPAMLQSQIPPGFMMPYQGGSYPMSMAGLRLAQQGGAVPHMHAIQEAPSNVHKIQGQVDTSNQRFVGNVAHCA